MLGLDVFVRAAKKLRHHRCLLLSLKFVNHYGPSLPPVLKARKHQVSVNRHTSSLPAGRVCFPAADLLVLHRAQASSIGLLAERGRRDHHHHHQSQRRLHALLLLRRGDNVREAVQRGWPGARHRRIEQGSGGTFAWQRQQRSVAGGSGFGIVEQGGNATRGRGGVGGSVVGEGGRGRGPWGRELPQRD